MNRLQAVRYGGALLLLLAASAAMAQVTISEAWVRGTAPGMKATGAYMQILSKRETRLVGAASPAAKTVEVHEMSLVDDVMRMRAIASLPVVPGTPLELKPGGYHVMLIDLVKPLAPGASVALALTFEGKDGKRETVQVQARVRPLAASGPAGAAGQGGAKPMGSGHGSGHAGAHDHHAR